MERFPRQGPRAAVGGTRLQKQSLDPWLQEKQRQRERFRGKMRYTKKHDKEERAEWAGNTHKVRWEPEMKSKNSGRTAGR